MSESIAERPAAEHVLELLRQIVTAAAQGECSDLHLRPQAPPWGRQGGRLVRMNTAPLSADELLAIIMVTAGRAPPQDAHSMEYSMDGGSSGVRLRCHAYRETEGWALAIRLIPQAIPELHELRLPPVVKNLAVPRAGLVLITGPMGSGKSTTAASILHTLARTETCHVITLEDPIEHVLSGTLSCVNQREIGRHAQSTSDALHEALRQDADVLFLGELRDPKDLEVALHAAEMGVAVYTTFHAHGALATFQRLVAMHAPEHQQVARERISETLRGVISQRLLPRRGTPGRVLCTEVLLNNHTVKENLRDPAKLKNVVTVMERGGDQGLHTFDQALTQLCLAGVISADVACAVAASPGNIRRALQLAGITTA